MMHGRRSDVRTLVGAAVLAALCPAAAAAQFEWTSSRPDGHAPIGVMADHVHEKGETMLSYRFMRMTMDGNRVNTDEVTTQDVLDDFPVTPLRMPMTMHMAGIMYAPAARLTLALMVPFVEIEMDHVNRAGAEFTTNGSGLGDVGLTGLVSLVEVGSIRAHLNLGFSFPTGSITEQDVTPLSNGNEVQLPYPMQVGSGTWDARPGITVLGMTPSWSWGGQAVGTVRLGENDQGYTLGNRVEGTAWAGVKVHDWVSLSVRAAASRWGDIDGADPSPSVNPTVVPTARTDLRGGTRVDLPVGVNVYAPTGALRGHRLAAEVAVPLYQDLNGPQLQTEWLLTLGWQKSF